MITKKERKRKIFNTSYYHYTKYDAHLHKITGKSHFSLLKILFRLLSSVLKYKMVINAEIYDGKENRMLELGLYKTQLKATAQNPVKAGC